MKNRYEVRGDVTAIFVYGKGETHECLIDTADLPLVDSFTKNSWHALWMEDSQTFYAAVYTPMVNRVPGRVVLMHRVLLKPSADRQIDHVHHNGLDNRRSEIRIATRRQNQLNRQRIDPRSKTGIRGVSWSKRSSKWVVIVSKHGNSKSLGLFADINEAAKVANNYYASATAEITRSEAKPSGV